MTSYYVGLYPGPTEDVRLERRGRVNT